MSIVKLKPIIQMLTVRPIIYVLKPVNKKYKVTISSIKMAQINTNCDVPTTKIVIETLC